MKQKKKRAQNRSYLYALMIPVVLFLIGILFVSVRNYVLTEINYFISIENSEQVRDIVVSVFSIGEATQADVENALADDIFDKLDCRNFTGSKDMSDSGIICETLGSYNIFFPKYYRIFLGFNEGVLSEIEVYFSYPDAL